MMAISTVNIARAALLEPTGLREWLGASISDVICLQATGWEQGSRIQHAVEDTGWHVVLGQAERDARGVAILTRAEPETSRAGFDAGEFDDRGRYAEVDPPDVVVGSVHLPPGLLDEAAYDERSRFLRAFSAYLVELRARAEAGSKEVLICGAGNLIDREDDETVEPTVVAVEGTAATAPG